MAVSNTNRKENLIELYFSFPCSLVPIVDQTVMEEPVKQKKKELPDDLLPINE